MTFLEKYIYSIFIAVPLIMVLMFVAMLMVTIDISNKGGLPTAIGQWVNEYEQAKQGSCNTN